MTSINKVYQTLLSVLIVAVAHGQGLLLEISDSSQGFGTAVARVGDLDHDGLADIVVGVPGKSFGAATFAGAAIIYSSATKLPILTCTNAVANEVVGIALSADCDFDGDGVPDVIAGAYSNDLGDTLLGAGKVFVFSGLTGQKLLGAIGPHKNAFLGSSVACVGDVDLDGFPDYAASAPGETTFGSGPIGLGAGAIRVYSGLTGALIRHLSGSVATSQAGRFVRAMDDFDVDGVPEIMFSMDDYSNPEHFEVLSGANSNLLAMIPGTRASMHHPDVNGDGFMDPVISEPVTPFRAVVYSGATLQPIVYSQYFSTAPGDGLNDVNLDGREDFVVFGTVNGKHSTIVVSGADGGLLRSDETWGGPLFSEIVDLGDVNGDGAHDFGYGYPSSGGFAFVHSSVCGKTSTYGSACPPTVGATPAITITNSCPTPGGAWNMTLSGPPGSALLMVGAQPAAAYIGGGCQLLVGPPATLFPIPFAFGFSILNTKLPLTSPVGKLYLQLFCSDPTKPWGYAASKGLEVTID